MNSQPRSQLDSRSHPQGKAVGWLARVRLAMGMVVGMGIVILSVFAGGCGSGGKGEVVVYAAQDQVYAEPLFAQFTRETGIRVRVLYDSEAVKTVGLANRLLAERSRPVCDVFWGNEELRTRQLESSEVWREDNPWVAFGCRSRRLVVNTNLVAASGVPRSLLELTNRQWAGKVVFAYPLFGTTATHFLALEQHWGRELWRGWCERMAANHPLIVDGNSVAARMVARGEAVIGLTDSDDFRSEVGQGAPLRMLPLMPELLLIPNTAAVVRGCPNPAGAQALVEFLSGQRVGQALVDAGALDLAAFPRGRMGTLEPEWPALVADLEASSEFLKRTFLR